MEASQEPGDERQQHSGGRRSQVGTDREVKNDTMEVWTLKVAPANLAHQACRQTKGKSQKKRKTKKKRQTTNLHLVPPKLHRPVHNFRAASVWLRTHSHLHSATSAALFKACRLKLCACVRAHIPQPLVSRLTARSRDAPAWRNLVELVRLDV